MSRTLLSLAGFQVIISGRFWVIAEDYFPLPVQWNIGNHTWLPYMVPAKGADWLGPLYPPDNMQRPTGPTCDGCHSMDYNIQTKQVVEWNVGCERCHGPGSEHVARLHEGIIEGRKAFGNVMKYLLMGTSSNFGNVLSMAAASLFLPFLPMLPTQILLNNLLYDLAQITIPTDNVDETYLQKPQRWDISLIRNFMLFIGPISSAFDFLTFYVLLHVFHTSEAQFHTGWFVESLATQTLVLFVIRTSKNPLRSRPSRPLIATCLGVVAIGIYLPFSPLAGVLGFTPLPVAYFTFLAIATGAYLLLVEAAKRHLLDRANRKDAAKPGETLAVAT